MLATGQQNVSRLPLVCMACKSNTKPRLVWMEGGCLAFAGKKVRFSIARRVFVGRCPWCNKEWEYKPSVDILA